MRPILLFLMVLLACTAPAVAAEASDGSSDESASAAIDENDAEAVYQRGRQRFGEGDLQGALDDYRRACEIECTWERSANRGNAAYQLGLYAESASAIQLAISRVSPADESTRGKLSQRLEQARARCGTVTLQIEPAGAEVLVDGVSVGRAPFAEPVFVMAGLRKFEALLGGKRVADERAIEQGGELTVTLAVPLGGDDDAPTPPPGDEGDSSVAALALGIGGLVLGAGAIVGGIVSLLAASGQGDDAAALQSQIETDPAAPSENPCGEGGLEVAGCGDLRSAVDSEATLGATGTTLLIVGGVLAAAGLTVLLWPGDDPANDDGSDDGGDEVAVSLRIGPGAVSIGGSF